MCIKHAGSDVISLVFLRARVAIFSSLIRRMGMSEG